MTAATSTKPRTSYTKRLLVWAFYAVLIAAVLSSVRSALIKPPQILGASGLLAKEFTTEPLPRITSMYFSSSDVLFAATENGDIFVLADQLKDGRADVQKKVASGMNELLGIYPFKDRIYVSEQGSIAYLEDKDDDGVFESKKTIIRDLPTGRHQNNNVVIGPDERVYVGVGSTTDRGPEPHKYSSTILSSRLDGSDLKVFARGFRNPYGLAFDQAGRLFATDNGPDDPPAPDELNLVQQGKNYGFPDEFGLETTARTEPPIAIFDIHSSSNSIIFLGDAYGATYDGMPLVAQFGEFFGSKRVGRKLVWVDLENTDPRSNVHEFFGGLERPLALAKDSLGRVYFSEYDSGQVFRLEPAITEVSGGRPQLDTNPFRELQNSKGNTVTSEVEASGQVKQDEDGAGTVPQDAATPFYLSPIFLLLGVILLLAVGIILLRMIGKENKGP